MKLSRDKWIVVIAFAIATGGALWLSQRSKEPRYQGKTVRQWIKIARPCKTYYTNSQGVFYTADYNHKELLRMLDTMGSNAGPSLIQILDEGDSLMIDLKRMIARSKWATDSMKSAASAGLGDSLETLMITSHTIRYLGSNAVQLIPDLERITCDSRKPSAAFAAAGALKGFGFQALPALHRSLTNAPSARQPMVSGMIQNIYREALRSDDARNREDAALALSEYPKPPFEIISVLLDILESPDPNRQKQSLNALAIHLPTMAPLLVAARKAVTRMAASEDPEIRRLANKILADLRHHESKQKP